MSSLSTPATVRFSTLLRELRAALEEHFGGWEEKSSEDQEEVRRAAGDIVEVAKVSFLSFFQMECLVHDS